MPCIHGNEVFEMQSADYDMNHFYLHRILAEHKILHFNNFFKQLKGLNTSISFRPPRRYEI